MDDVKKKQKAERKRNKFTARLKQSKGINCVSEPSHSIALCNAGQATGLTKEDLFLSYNIPNDAKYVAEKGESHSFLVFRRISDAELFYNSCHGMLDMNGSPVYMCYVDKSPSTHTTYNYSPPTGLSILENFVTENEERELLEIFNFTNEINLKNREVKHYGYEFRYGSNDVDLSSPLDEGIPEVCDVLWERLKENAVSVQGRPDQMTVNKYLPGQGIPSHVDKHSPFGDTILSLSLGSQIVMDWRHHSGKHVPVNIPARSIMVMRGEARYDWRHGIQPRTHDPVHRRETIIQDGVEKEVIITTNDVVARGTRISLTFRWTRKGDCVCVYPILCDSRTKCIDGNMASDLEELHVHQVYEQISSHFSTTRHKPWPKVLEFMREVQPGAVVLDLGCGNGKNILRRHDILQLACERSTGLLSECKTHISDIGAADAVRLDLLNTTLKNGCADVIICIAVVHHFSSEQRRRQAIETIARLLRPGGRTLITVWAKDQTKSNYLKQKPKTDIKTENAQYTTINGVSLPIHENRTQFEHNDLLVPWKLRNVENKLLKNTNETLLRYYHVFEEFEIDCLCEKVPGLIVENSFYEEGNWCVVCRKL